MGCDLYSNSTQELHIVWAKNSIDVYPDYSLYVYCRLPYFKGLAETRVHLPHLETSTSMAAMLQYMIRIMKMKQLVGQQFTPFKAFMVQQSVHHFYFSSEMVDGMHIECQYVGGQPFCVNKFICIAITAIV